MPVNSYYDSDERIANFIRTWKTEYYDEMISGDESRRLVFQLSTLRKALIAKYPFGKTDSALEIGSGFGAMTGQLLDIFDSVDTVCETDLRAECIGIRYAGRNGLGISTRLSDFLYEGKKYDLIIAVEEPGEEPWITKMTPVFEILKEHLDEEGTMLLGIRESVAKALLIKTLNSAGFYFVREYYPLPDLCFTQEIYSRDRLPDLSCFSRLDMLSADGKKSAAGVSKSLRESIKDGTFADRHPCALLECRRSEAQDRFSYMSIGMERDREHASYTIERENLTEKTALYEEGDAFVGGQTDVLNKMRMRGLDVVHCSISGMMGSGGSSSRFRLNMSVMETRTLLAYIAEGACEDRTEVIRLFEKLYGDIMRSSVPGPEDTGAVTGFVDMIPAKAYYDEESDRYIYFDQEFIREDSPVSFVMYRALRHTWKAVPELEKTLPLREAMGMFGINEEEAASYKENDDEMMNKIMNSSLKGQLHEWCGAKPAESSVPVEDPVRRGVREVRMDLFRKFDTVCEIYHLKYTAIGSTLLDAVRDGDMAPWNDNISLAMPRMDYDRLCTVAPEAFERPYFLQTPESDEGCFYGGYAKLRNSDTAATEWFNEDRECNQGIWIDIFPLDDCADTAGGLREQQKKVCFRQRLIYAKRYPLSASRIIDSDPKKLSLYYMLSSGKSDKKLCRDLHKACTKYPMSSHVTVFAYYYSEHGNTDLYSSDDLRHLVRVPFGDAEIYVPENYRGWLGEKYGISFMARPPRDQRIPSKDADYDPETSYSKIISVGRSGE